MVLNRRYLRMDQQTRSLEAPFWSVWFLGIPSVVQCTLLLLVMQCNGKPRQGLLHTMFAKIPVGDKRSQPWPQLHSSTNWQTWGCCSSWFVSNQSTAKPDKYLCRLSLLLSLLFLLGGQCPSVLEDFLVDFVEDSDQVCLLFRLWQRPASLQSSA